MVGTHALYRSVGKKKYPVVESSTWPLNSHNCSENYIKTTTTKKDSNCSDSWETPSQSVIAYNVLDNLQNQSNSEICLRNHGKLIQYLGIQDTVQYRNF